MDGACIIGTLTKGRWSLTQVAIAHYKRNSIDKGSINWTVFSKAAQDFKKHAILSLICCSTMLKTLLIPD